MKTEWLFENFPFISSDKLTLCRIQPSDEEALLELFSDEEFMKYNQQRYSFDRFSMGSFFKRIEEGFVNRQSVLLGIYFNDRLNELLGTILIKNIDKQINSAEIEFALRSGFRGQGIASTAVGEIVKFLFDRVGVNRIWASAIAENRQAGHVLISCGFIKEGTCRKGVFWEDKGVVSLSTYSLLREEFGFVRSSGLIARDGQLAIARMTGNDYEVMAKWLSDEKVLKYYDGRDNPSDLAKVIAAYQPKISGDSDETPCIISYNGNDIGYIQFYPIKDEIRELRLENYKNPYGIDLFIGESSARGKGLGPKIIRMLCTYLFNKLDADVIVSDPQFWNERSINTFRKCGFTQAAVLAEHELHEGKMETNIIMHRVKE